METTDTYNQHVPEYINPREQSLTVRIDDISTAKSVYVVMPTCSLNSNFLIRKVTSVIDGAIATADDVLTVKDGDGNSMGTITVAYSGSAAKDKDSLAPAANNLVAGGETVEIATGGQSTNAVAAYITIDFVKTEA